ncbi:MAG: hypothetical protein JSV03_14330 [Planctomycetota bacterium]|nr:MAG: hypothetical protein JSV03_14330 [Planctomycetota bacterium]
MPQNKQTVVSFRVDQHLADILNNLPDKSTFIREAIMRRFYTVCPFCNGHGVMPQLIADWLQTRVPEYESVECTCCHYAYPVEIVAQQVETGGSEPFVCRHCADHEHSH